MSFDSLDGALFGDCSESELELQPPPDYINSVGFKQFAAENDLRVDEKYGFIQLKTLSDYYFTGQVVRGYALITVFNQLKGKNLYLTVRGFEQPGSEYIGEVVKSMKNYVKTFKPEAKNHFHLGRSSVNMSSLIQS